MTTTTKSSKVTITAFWIACIFIPIGVIMGIANYTSDYPELEKALEETEIRIQAWEDEVLESQAAVVSASDFGSITIDEVASVYDGDTFRANISGWPDIVGKRIGIRLKGIDAPEKRGTSDEIKELAEAARQELISLLDSAKVIDLRNIERGKYFRIIADVYVDDVNVSKILIEKKLAKPYDGGTKPTWTILDYERYF